MVATRRGVRVHANVTNSDESSEVQATPPRRSMRTTRAAQEPPPSPLGESSLQRCTQASRLHSPPLPCTPSGSVHEDSVHEEASDVESCCSASSSLSGGRSLRPRPPRPSLPSQSLTRSRRRAPRPPADQSEQSDVESCSSAPRSRGSRRRCPLPLSLRLDDSSSGPQTPQTRSRTRSQPPSCNSDSLESGPSSPTGPPSLLRVAVERVWKQRSGGEEQGEEQDGSFHDSALDGTLVDDPEGTLLEQDMTISLMEQEVEGVKEKVEVKKEDLEEKQEVEKEGVKEEKEGVMKEEDLEEKQEVKDLEEEDGAVRSSAPPLGQLQATQAPAPGQQLAPPPAEAGVVAGDQQREPCAPPHSPQATREEETQAEPPGLVEEVRKEVMETQAEPPGLVEEARKEVMETQAELPGLVEEVRKEVPVQEEVMETQAEPPWLVEDEEDEIFEELYKEVRETQAGAGQAGLDAPAHGGSSPARPGLVEPRDADLVQKKTFISLLDSSDEEESEEEEEESDGGEEGESEGSDEEGDESRPPRSCAPSSVDGLFMIDTQPSLLEEGAGLRVEGAGQEEQEDFVDEEVDDDEEDEDAQLLFSSCNPRSKEMSSYIDPGLRLKQIGGLYISFDGSRSKPASSALKKLRDEKIQKLLKKSVIGPEFEKQDACPVQSKRSVKLKHKAERETSAGGGWFDMKAPEVTPEIRADLRLLKMRGALDPKRFYKKDDRDGFPKYFQLGTVVDSPMDFYHSRVPKKQRKRTMVEELLVDAEFRHKNKKKFQQIMTEKAAQAVGRFKKKSKCNKK